MKIKLLIATLLLFLIVFLYFFIKQPTPQKKNNEMVPTKNLKLCNREQPLNNLPEFQRSLSLIEQRINPSVVSVLTKEIFPCITVKYSDVRKNFQAEWYFLFNNKEASLNYYPIYVDSSYRNTDDLLTAILLSHEIVHASQYAAKLVKSSIEVSCLDYEVMAFYFQSQFIVSLNQEEIKSLMTRAIDDNNPHPQIQYVQNFLKEAIPIIDRCKELLDENNEKEKYGQCLVDSIWNYFKKLVYDSPYYQKQCGLK